MPPTQAANGVAAGASSISQVRGQHHQAERPIANVTSLLRKKSPQGATVNVQEPSSGCWVHCRQSPIGNAQARAGAGYPPPPPPPPITTKQQVQVATGDFYLAVQNYLLHVRTS